MCEYCNKRIARWIRDDRGYCNKCVVLALAGEELIQPIYPNLPKRKDGEGYTSVISR